jgi:hypothetical protein
LKKAAQKLLECWSRAFESPLAQIKKSLLLRAGRPGFSSENKRLPYLAWLRFSDVPQRSLDFSP